jgi:uncharacterized protein (TIGR03435 family)
MRHIGVALVLGLAVIAVAVMPAVSQTPAQKPAFEVASIKQAVFPSDAYFAGWSDAAGCNPARISISGNRITLSKMSLCSLIASAYDIRDYLISGAPDWMMKRDRSLYFEIQATAPDTGGTFTPERAREMLQTLLTDRFQLKAHWEMKELPVYALVVGKNGPKLTLSAHGTCSHFPNASILGDGLAVSCNPVETMDELAEGLSRYTDRPVLNRTGIEGGQVYELQWAGNAVDIEAVATRPSEGGSLFTAIQKQLGLRLDPTRAMVKVLVVDSVQRPTEN